MLPRAKSPLSKGEYVTGQVDRIQENDDEENAKYPTVFVVAQDGVPPTYVKKLENDFEHSKIKTTIPIVW